MKEETGGDNRLPVSFSATIVVNVKTRVQCGKAAIHAP
jgi:hypothetical protein